MIVDSSVIVAILQREPDFERYAHAIAAAPERSIAAPTLLETSIVLRRHGAQVEAALREFIAAASMTILSFGAEHLAAAQDAFRRFGRGSGHPAKLNFGDCFSYAAAIVTARPLLFKGDDFIHTDLVAALR